MSSVESNGLNQTTDAILVVDRAWQLRSLNPAAQQFFKDESHTAQMTLWQRVPQWQGTLFEQECRAVMQTRLPVRFEAASSWRNCWLNVEVSPHSDGILICLRNVSERKQMEAEMLERSRLATLTTRVSQFVTHAHRLGECLDYMTQILVEELDQTIAAIWLYNPQQHRLEQASVTIAKPLKVFAQSALPVLHARTLSLGEPLGEPGSESRGAPGQTWVNQIARTLDPIFDQALPREDLNFVIDQNAFLPVATTLETLERQLATDPLNPQLFCDRLVVDRWPASLFFTGYPLVVEDRLIGVMALWTQASLPSCFEAGLALLADHLALDIERCRAKSALRSRPEALLFRLASQMRDSLDLNTILETAVQEIRELLAVDSCSYLWCWSEQEQPATATAPALLLVSHEARADAQVPTLSNNLTIEQQDFLVQCLSQQRLLHLDATAPSTPDASLLQDLGMAAVLLLPLETRSGHVGAIVCAHRQVARTWQDQELELLQAVVNQLAVAIDQAELFAQAKAAARAAQTQAQYLETALQDLRQAQSQLVQTEKMSSLGQMVAGVAHEINNPVNFISGNLGYTEDYVKDLLRLVKLYQTRVPQPDAELQALTEEIDLGFILEDLPKTLASMQVGAERIRQIVLSLRNFSRLDQTGMKPVDIHEGIDSTLLILHNRLKAKGTRSEIEIQKDYADLPRVDCYASQLNQVFMNILANAIDALEGQSDPQDSQRIQITTRHLSAGEPAAPNNSPEHHLPENNSQAAVLIEIADNGPGMSPETVERIFDPFFTTKPVGKGTGLGLSISYQIVVEKHRGAIECQSQLGEGTQFRIQIPCHPPNTEQ
ncbi:MAG: ATP-binding protein [Cyanobacteria bacterium P01_G01_bin.54]